MSSNEVLCDPAQKRRNSIEKTPPKLSDLRIVLLGRSVSETSRVGNFILGRAAFETEAPPAYVEHYSERVRGKHMTVINTPLLLNPDLTLRHITQGLRECVSLSAPGPHVIVLVLKPDECSREEKVCMEIVLSSFCDNVFEHTMVLTTQEPESVEPNEVNDVTKEIITICFNKHYSLDRNSTPSDLIATFEKIVQRKDGCHLICNKNVCFAIEATEQEVEKGQKKTIRLCQPAVNNNQKMSRENTSNKTMEKDHSNENAISVPHKIKNNWSRKIEAGSNENLPIFTLQLDETWQNSDGFCRRSTFGKDTTKPNKTIMMIGATGAGKNTLINSMINYILGVRWEDDFRFVLIDEGKQKSEITTYQINHMDGFQVPYSLTIVDTPGFGDTRGISHDQKITKQIQEFFSHPGGIDHIDAVCFVVQASLARLTHTQKYIFDSILSIFGKDIAENILMMVTFADAKTPPVLEAIKVSEVPCSTNESGEPLHFKFNNSAVFASSNKSEDEEYDCENFDQMFWKMGFSSMKKFFESLNKIETKSLSLTREVLKERKQLEVLVESLQPQINAGLTKLDQIRKMRADHLEQCMAYGLFMPTEDIFEEPEKELTVVQDTVASLIEQPQKSLKRLQEIALKPNHMSTPDYIDVMIESEKQEAKPGFQDRIQSLLDIRKRTDIISKVSTREVLPEDLKEYKPETRESQAPFDPKSHWFRSVRRRRKMCDGGLPLCELKKLALTDLKTYQ